MIHNKPAPFAGQTVRLKDSFEHPQFDIAGAEFHVEDWWDRVAGKSWMFCDGNPGCLVYALRSGLAQLPLDNEVLYGKVGGLGHLIHVSEIQPENEGVSNGRS